MGISEIIMMMLVYGGLFLYIVNLSSSNNIIIVYVKWASLIILYGFISTIIWFTYKGEEDHTNSHSGYEPISFTGEASLMIVGITIYSVILFLKQRFLNKR